MIETLTQTAPQAKNSQHCKTTIVEFVGPPGVGKTTSCNFFAQALQAKGITVCQSEDLKNYFRTLGKIQKLQLYTGTFLLQLATLLQFITVLARHKIYSLNSVYRFLRLAVFQKALQKMVKNRRIDLVLLDQWMIQELWSATIFKTNTVGQLPATLRKFYFPTDFLFYFDLDLETAANRIASRPTNRSRFDLMPHEKRLTEMKKYTAYLHALYQHADCRQKYTLSTTQSPSHNCTLFLKHLSPVLPFHA